MAEDVAVCPDCDGDGWYTPRALAATGGKVNCLSCNGDWSKADWGDDLTQEAHPGEAGLNGEPLPTRAELAEQDRWLAENWR